MTIIIYLSKMSNNETFEVIDNKTSLNEKENKLNDIIDILFQRFIDMKFTTIFEKDGIVIIAPKSDYGAINFNNETSVILFKNSEWIMNPPEKKFKELKQKFYEAKLKDFL